MGDYTKNRDIVKFVTDNTPPPVPATSSQPLDVKQLAEELSKYMKKEEEKKVEARLQDDNEKVMSKLSERMIVQRGNKESNFNDLGNMEEITKRTEDVDKTIDLLKNLGD
jgi:hypothetical protein